MKKLSIFLVAILPFFSFSQTRIFYVIGYVPNWIDVSAFANSFDFKRVTHINFAFQNPDANGNLIESNTGLMTLVNKAHENDVKVLVSLGGGGAAGGTTLTNYQNLISSAEKRADFIHRIAIYLKQFNLDGIDVDEEGPAINSNYGPFIKQLTDSLRPKGYLITAAVGWGGGSIQNTTLRLFDFISLMSYDYTGYWDPGNPGQHSPYWYAQSMINEYIGRGVDKDKIALGVPFYGYGFYNETGYQAYNEIISRFPDAYTVDKVSDTVYYNGTNTIRNKTNLALNRVAGIMIWELSLDMIGDKSLLKVIDETLDSAGVNGLGDLSMKSIFHIFPNPAMNNLNIRNESISTLGYTANLTDIYGRELIRNNFSENNENTDQIDISFLPTGTYILRIVTDNKVYSSVIIKL